VKTLKRGNVLIVDDNKEEAISIKENLEEAGYEVSAAYCGNEALEILTKGETNFHLMVTDLKMSGMNGLELIQKVNDIKLDIEKILLTGFPERDLVMYAKNLGVKESISKPSPAEFLKKTVNRILTEKALGVKKKNYLRKIKGKIGTSVEIKLFHRIAQDIHEYKSGSEILHCTLNGDDAADDVVLVSLYLLHLEARHGMCLSVSLGCPKNCPKCWSGTLIKFARHFTADEMLAMTRLVLQESFYYDKVFWLYDMPFFVAVMGSGDIAFNFNETITAMEKLYRIFGKRFICNISTAFGSGIKQLSNYIKSTKRAELFIPNLQISLDSVRADVRQTIIDSKEDPLNFIKLAEEYYRLTGKIITANFVMCQGKNDTKNEIEEIRKNLNPEIFRIKLSKSKLPPKTKSLSSEDKVIEKMRAQLEAHGFSVEIFDEKKQMGFKTGGSCGTIVHHL